MAIELYVCAWCSKSFFSFLQYIPFYILLLHIFAYIAFWGILDTVADCIGYCTCFIEILSYFFILQSLTTSKMRKFQTLKLSQFHKAKIAGLKTSGIMSNFWGEFFLCFGGQKKFRKFFWKHCSVRTKKLHKMKLKYI